MRPLPQIKNNQLWGSSRDSDGEAGDGQGRTLGIEGSSEETMRVLGGPEVALDESVFLVGMYKYKDKPFLSPLCPVLLATVPACLSSVAKGRGGKTSYHRIAIRPTSISFCIFCAITGFF